MSDWHLLDRKTYTESSEYCEARCRYCLPMSKCPVCGDYRGFPEIEYPSVDPDRVFDRKTLSSLIELRNPKSDWGEFLKLKGKLRAVLPSDSLLAPACGFGPMLTTVFKRFEGFNCAGLGRIVASEKVLETLKASGIELQSAPALVKGAKGVDQLGARYVCIPMFGLPTEDAKITICAECDRPSRPLIRGADDGISKGSIPSGIALFRLAHSPTKLVFRDDLKRLLTTDIGIKSLSFSPLRIA